MSTATSAGRCPSLSGWGRPPGGAGGSHQAGAQSLGSALRVEAPPATASLLPWQSPLARPHDVPISNRFPETSIER